MKFDMGEGTLSHLTRQSAGSSDELGALIRQLVAAAEPLEGRFSGAGKAAFTAFKNNADAITAQLNGALAGIVRGQSGMDLAFQTGDQSMMDNARGSEGRANYSAANFRARA